MKAWRLVFLGNSCELELLLENEQKSKELCDLINKIEHMKKSILTKAFRGELGTNNSDEECAENLLKEIINKDVS